ncbi:hypothetical protein DOTSEDRAFT_70971 [Dothistroma septosporum NZE10]|uniref:N-acetyltransferase domain-containing protein n=1 Tax=Dothistroma septosporum (strain NZE10 / CBS 128990) TaxID=675120 RepID=N1PQ92_DOTSN|nr:hypothetical protein DOTSEDRAFT_70971 [Dothistroma septosporum NZE10]
MPLKLLPLPQTEWQMYSRVCKAAFIPGILSVLYPEGYSDEAQKFGLDALHRTAERNPGRIQMMKVVDEDLPEDDPFQKVVGISQWKIFPRERTEEEMKEEAEEGERDDAEFGAPPGLSAAARDDFADGASVYKKKHLGRKPHVLLHILATRPEHERRGVGAMSLAWGTKKADELGLPMYLEGSPKGVGLYKKWGFEVVAKLPWDATVHGYHEPLEHVAMLRPAKKSV